MTHVSFFPTFIYQVGTYSLNILRESEAQKKGLAGGRFCGLFPIGDNYSNGRGSSLPPKVPRKEKARNEKEQKGFNSNAALMNYSKTQWHIIFILMLMSLQVDWRLTYVDFPPGPRLKRQKLPRRTSSWSSYRSAIKQA